MGPDIAGCSGVLFNDSSSIALSYLLDAAQGEAEHSGDEDSTATEQR